MASPEHNETEHVNLEGMSSPDLHRVLCDKVKGLIPGYFLGDLLVEITVARKRTAQIYDQVLSYAAAKEVGLSQTPYSRTHQDQLRNLLALESLVDFCLTSSQGAFFCTKPHLEELVTYAAAYDDKLRSESRGSTIRDLGALREEYERSIPFHAVRTENLSPQTPAEIQTAMERAYEENKRYLDSVFPKHLGFSWEGFVDTIGNLLTFFPSPGCASKVSLCSELKDNLEASVILQQLEYTPDRAHQRMSLRPTIRSRMQGRLLVRHPIPSISDHLFLSQRLLSDSFNWYVYSYRKISHAFLKEKGHSFEARIAKSLDEHSWQVIAQNLVVMEEVVPSESKAEYDIIARKGRYLLIIEAKAYAPEVGSSGYTESKREKLACDFACKLRRKAEFLAENTLGLGLGAKGCEQAIPVLLSTYPLSASHVRASVLVCTEREFVPLLSNPQGADGSVLIDIRGAYLAVTAQFRAQFQGQLFISDPLTHKPLK